MKIKNFVLKTRSVCVALVVVLSYIVVYYTVDNMQFALPTSAGVNEPFTIVLDAGHGGMDGGCTSAAGVLEKGINLAIMLEVRDLCTVLGYKVEVTRDSDISIHDKNIEGVGNQKRSDMDNRLALFNKNSNALCISIHQNKFTDPQYSGAQMFYADTNPQNERLARVMQGQFVANLQPDNTREIKPCGRELFLCYFCKNPTLMIECGFLSNPDEAEKLSNEEYQRDVAFTIFSGINEFLQVNNAK